MEAFKKDKILDETNILHKSGNIRELLKVGKSSNINLDISRLSSKGFSNLLEKAKKLQEIKKKEEKSREEKSDELDLITKKGKENVKSNNNSMIKISNDFEILKKFSQRMNSKKINNLLTSIDTQSSLKEENYYGITTTANTNTNSNINSNFNTEKTKTKESIDNGNNESKNEKDKEKDNDESSIDYIKKTVTNNVNMEKRKYSHFYSILNGLNSKNNNKSNNIKSKFKPRNKNITIFNPDSLYQNSENIDNTDENKKNESHNCNESNTNYNDSKYNNDSKNNDSKNNNNDTNHYNSKFNNNETSHYNNDSKYNSETNNNNTDSKYKYNNNESNSQNINKNKDTLNLNEYQNGTANSCCFEDILNDLDNIHDSFEKNNNSKKDENSEDDNSFDLKLYEKYNNKNSFEGINSPNYNDNEINENDYNREENDYDIPKEKNEDKILNFEEEIYNDIDSKAIEYETVNSNYSIKQCNTVLEYSFREDQNISYCSTMEDKSKSIENFNNNKKQMVFQLFDGYKGEEVSNYLQQNFTHIYKQYLEENKGNIPRSLVKSFKEIDEKIKKLENCEGKSSTGTVIHIIWENKNKLMVYTGNVGNTRASLVSPVYVIKLTQEQPTPETKIKNLKNRYKKNIKNNILRKKSDNEEDEKKFKIFGKYKMDEDEEIEKDKKYGYKRFNRLKYKKEKNINKNEESEDKLIECIPYIAKMEIDLGIKNQYLFLASDGIWDKVDEEEIQQTINNIKDTEQLCSNIVKNALHRDTKDNISIFSIKLT